LASINVKSVNGQIDVEEFDCKKKTYNSKAAGSVKVESVAFLQQMLELACKRSWEVWK